MPINRQNEQYRHNLAAIQFNSPQPKSIDPRLINSAPPIIVDDLSDSSSEYYSVPSDTSGSQSPGMLSAPSETTERCARIAFGNPIVDGEPALDLGDLSAMGCPLGEGTTERDVESFFAH